MNGDFVELRIKNKIIRTTVEKGFKRSLSIYGE